MASADINPILLVLADQRSGEGSDSALELLELLLCVNDGSDFDVNLILNSLSCIFLELPTAHDECDWLGVGGCRSGIERLVQKTGVLVR